MDADEEDFVFYGTPIECEEDASSRKKKAVAEASGQLRTLVPWKQEVRDEEGRRRFHGAFTGGYSAGYYNTVGSKEGWTPQSFTSSRKNRAEIQPQSVDYFLDDEEKAELEGRSFATSMQFDTFGFTSAERARKHAEQETKNRPSAIPGPIPDEIVVPATESIGVKLLMKMGWRRGRSIKESRASSLYDVHGEAGKAFLGLSVDDKAEKSELVDYETRYNKNSAADDSIPKSTPVYVINPKQDLYGLGYDPFKDAPEFREKKRRMLGTMETNQRKPLSVGDSLFGFKSRRVAPGFGIGALEDLDVEDEDVFTAGYDFEEFHTEEIEEPSRPMIENVKLLDKKKSDVLPGFNAAANSDYQLERFGPPVIPKDFVPYHKFTSPLDIGNKFGEAAPPEVAPPEDNSLRLAIEGMATLVAHCGKLFEDLSRQKNQANPLFSFLFGGNGQDYYARKLWEGRQKHDKKWQWNEQKSHNVEKMTAENRGRMLGEKPLEKSLKDSATSSTSVDNVTLQFNLSDTFTTPVSFTGPTEVVKPFQEDPEKQDRFEQFLKEKYHGGLRTKDTSGSSKMTEAARARERLEFDAAAQAIEKGNWRNESKPPSELLGGVIPTGGLQFMSGGLEQAGKLGEGDLVKKMKYPKREEFQWRPSPILCKRFDLTDPYMGKPPPPPRARSKMDALIVMPEHVAVKSEDNVMLDMGPSISQMGGGDKTKGMVDEDMMVAVDGQNIERPVDLYKAIFSDDSDDEEENNNWVVAEDPGKKVEVANKTLNQMIAGDFLESLGKELGLEVPPDVPYSESKDSGVPTWNENWTADKGDRDMEQVINNHSSTVKAVGGSFMAPEKAQASHRGNVHGVGSNLQQENSDGIDVDINARKTADAGTLDRNYLESASKEERKTKAPSHHYRNQISDSSEDVRERKRSRHRRRRSYSDSETSDGSRHHSRSKEKRKRSSQEMSSSSRRHSKHHKHRHRESSEKNPHYGSERERRKDKYWHKYKD